MPIIINTQNICYQHKLSFARSYKFDNLSIQHKGPIDAKMLKYIHQFKTPRRVNINIVISALLGPFTKESSSSLSNIQWKTANANLPMSYRRTEISQKIHIPIEQPSIKKLIEVGVSLKVLSSKIMSGRIIINYQVSSTIKYIPRWLINCMKFRAELVYTI